MNGSGIGVPHILPRTGADWQDDRHAPDRQKEGSDRKPAPDNKTARGQPAPGTGRLLDLTV